MVSIDHLTNLDYADLTLKFSQPIYEKTCRKKNRELVEGSWTKQKMRFTKLVNKSYFPHPHSQWKGGGGGGCEISYPRYTKKHKSEKKKPRLELTKVSLSPLKTSSKLSNLRIFCGPLPVNCCW